MNEHQDQTLWWEVDQFSGLHWVYKSDHDSREDALEWKRAYEEMFPAEAFRVRRVTGLPD